MKKYITVKQASEFLNISASSVRRYNNAGILKSRRHKFNGYRVFDLNELIKFKKNLGID